MKASFLVISSMVKFSCLLLITEASNGFFDKCVQTASELVQQEIVYYQRQVHDSQSVKYMNELHQNFQDFIKSCFVSYVKYNLFTPKNPDEAFEFKANAFTLQDSPFDSDQQTKFVIHGWSAGLPKESVLFDLKDEFLKVGNYNVIVVDWTRYNNFSYPISSAYTVVVGIEISKLVGFLQMNTGIAPESVHIIGHSLGAHIAGFAGKGIQNLGRITGLDAAGPVFDHVPDSLRLSHRDALFVDTIHTNGAKDKTEGYGFLSPYGHIDFFPNGGSQQAGCEYQKQFLTSAGENKTINSQLDRGSCNHNRALYLFKASINHCKFTSVLYAIKIESGSQYFYVKNSVYEEMGFNAKPNTSLPIKSSFYLRTLEHYPFCLDKEQQV